ncbi:hypothetical protein [Methanosarcina sp. 2.H.A.1B.4]|uniref:hypothetical protein n=1 Tax=Methanosarcina sp. 2.H.A.1B.4 TaxID=1483600 RepID=UPI000621E0E4|nr:hypothetical protein [Methanosarcina sp. 2.H.A.1B.4]KKG08960.1 hypothetical protein EO92_00260 [Methanosarcina sp. 2.H.A.1B.4]
MRYQKVPGNDEKRFYSSPVHPAPYKLELNHSSQRFLFHYSVIEISPVNYESSLAPGSIEYTDEYTDIYADSRCSDLPADVDLTMEDPDIYLEYTGRLSESSKIHN